ncbi:MAG: hypothetical protein HYX72_04555 [Acidobacteria bacterium]|nr:hypothetical protein [Acidobacteriota bacterium]
MLRWLLIGPAVVLLACAGWIAYKVWPRQLKITLPSAVPVPIIQEHNLSLRAPFGAWLANIGSSDNELGAYLRFEFLKSQTVVDESRIFLTADERSNAPIYHIWILANDDLLTAIQDLATLRAAKLIDAFDFGAASRDEIFHKRQETAIFEAAYHEPVRQKLEALPRAQLLQPLIRFMVFKAKTDPRVMKEIEPVPTPPSAERVKELAADIIAVAQFFSLPLDFFLGIAAIENNYMNVRGDLNHVIWKRRAQKGDVILRRQKGRVLVRNYAIGVWQITRETLRYAHALYLADNRDYSALPPRLRPDRNLDLDLLNGPALTTYAGILFRNLLDHFAGDIQKALGAYNGGIRRPNLNYAQAVEVAAYHARNILEHAVALHEEAVARAKYTLVIHR